MLRQIFLVLVFAVALSLAQKRGGGKRPGGGGRLVTPATGVTDSDGPGSGDGPIDGPGVDMTRPARPRPGDRSTRPARPGLGDGSTRPTRPGPGGGSTRPGTRPGTRPAGCRGPAGQGRSCKRFRLKLDFMEDLESVLKTPAEQREFTGMVDSKLSDALGLDARDLTVTAIRGQVILLSFSSTLDAGEIKALLNDLIAEEQWTLDYKGQTFTPLMSGTDVEKASSAASGSSTTSAPGKDGVSNNGAIVAGAVVGGIVALALVAAFVYTRRISSRDEESLDSNSFANPLYAATGGQGPLYDTPTPPASGSAGAADFPEPAAAFYDNAEPSGQYMTIIPGTSELDTEA